MRHFTQSEKIKAEYCCQVVRINQLTPIEGSDFLAKTVVAGNTIVVRKDEFKEGDYALYAKNETALNSEFLSANNLFELHEYERNKNAKEVEKLLANDKKDEAKKITGFFNKYGRVKALKLRGVYSMGFLFHLETLAKWKPEVRIENLASYIVNEEMGIGENFDTVCGEEFIKAYVPYVPSKSYNQIGDRRERKRQKKAERFERIADSSWKFHYDTLKLNDSIWMINPEDTVSISVKQHGCVEYNTLVETMEYGSIKIGEIVENKLDCHIKAYDTILDEEVYVPIDKYYTIPNDGEWYEIEMENGRKLIITGNNPVWLPILNAYRRVDELNGDEYLLMS